MERLVPAPSTVVPHGSRRWAVAASRIAVDLRWFGLVFVIATCVRIMGQLALGAYQHPQVFEYEEVATNLVAGKGYLYGAPDGGNYIASQSSPLYIVVTALVYLLTDHSQLAMLLLQAVLGGLTAALAYWIGSRAFSPTAGMVAGILVALDPALVVFAAQLHSLTLDALFNVVLVAGTLAVSNRPRVGSLVGLGVTFGLAALDRATALLLLPLHLVWLRQYRHLNLLTSGLVITLIALVVYSPWPIRNTVVLGQLTFGSSESTEWLWRGNNPNATGASLTASGQRMIEVAPPEFRTRVQNATEAERMTIYRDAALSWITANPFEAARLYLEKLVGFWWGSDSSGILYPSLWLLGYRLWFVAVLLPAMFAAWRGLRDPLARPTTLLVLLTLLVVSATQAVFYVEGRHRIAIEPLLLILSGAGLAAWSITRHHTAPRSRADGALVSTRTG